MTTSKLPKLRHKEYQFTIRVPIKMKDIMVKRLTTLGMNALAEYVRHLIINDINGLEDYYGQTR